mmetsp:Transcript_5463/g.10401  ORF Transcript_5463/g.10401 Transcript_5463/m.10401 type:complete len:582 (+) Transcript_5463:35-1780(+)
MATIAPTTPNSETSPRPQEQSSSPAAPLECVMPDSYEPEPGRPEGPLTWRITYDKGYFRFFEDSMDGSSRRVISEGGWGYPDYFKMISLKTGDGSFALPRNCTELKIILEYRFADKSEACGSMKLVNEMELPEEERMLHTLIWNREGLIYPETGQTANTAKLSCASLFGMNLRGLDLSRGDFTGAALGFCDLTDCNFEMANCGGCNFAQASLVNVNFQHTRLEGAVLNGAKVAGAVFEGTYMDGTKSIEKVKSWDPLTWRTDYDDKDSDDEGEENDEEGAPRSADINSVSPKKARERERSIVESKKKDLKSFVTNVIESDVGLKEMVRAILHSGFEMRDIENIIDLVETHELEDNVRGSKYNANKRKLLPMLKRKVQEQNEKNFMAKITVPTMNSVNTKGSILERMSTFMSHKTRDPKELLKCKDEIRDVMSQLQEMRGPFLSETWVDQVDEWHELCLLQKGLSSERAMSVLKCIFEDKEVIRTLGMAEQLRTIRGKPPQGLMLRLKVGLGGHIKKNFFNYKRALDDELNNIEFIESQKQWVMAMSSSALVAFLIGAANFFSALAINKLCNSVEDSSYCPA